MASYSPSLTELASKISAAASVIDGYCTKNNLPQPSFDVNGPAALPNDPEVQVAKMQMQDALTSMTDLLLGPNALMSALVPVRRYIPSKREFRELNLIPLAHT